MSTQNSTLRYNILTTKVSTEFQNAFKVAPEYGKELYDVNPSGSATMVHTWMNNFSGMKKLVKGDAKIGANLERFTHSVPNSEFYDFVKIAESDIDDDMFASYDTAFKMMGQNAKAYPGQSVLELLNGAFDSTLVYDGSALCADSHTIGISTIDNKRTAALAQVAFDEAYQAINGFVAQYDSASKAEPLNAFHKYVLVVAPENEIVARELVMAKTVTNGGENVRAGLNIDVVINPFALTSAQKKYWFIINVGSGLKPFLWQNRKSPTLSDMVKDVETNTVMFSVDMRGAALATFPHLVIGSTGAS